jgi:hypothetical protein
MDKDSAESIEKSLTTAFKKQIKGISKTVYQCLKSRSGHFVNLQIEVLITKERLPNAVDLDKLSTTTVVRDLSDKKIKLDERSN